MNYSGTNFQLTVKPSCLMVVTPFVLWGAAVVLALLGPFYTVAKVLFIAIWLGIGVYYWYQLNRTRHYSQLRLESGNLILGFSHGQTSEPELIHLVGRQRVLPWLVELNIVREDGQRYCWGIAADAVSRDEFRQLKVFVKTHCG
ncbi:protein YgfX [Marinagarivorans algicola]|uniref:protein YgfX n=1 Tax=Marinagarivorans algicola TaxID=1513270 RepID=UPI0006B9E6BB|nr:protein YgfX [Marinagarivorans algicola]